MLIRQNHIGQVNDTRFNPHFGSFIVLIKVSVEKFSRCSSVPPRSYNFLSTPKANSRMFNEGVLRISGSRQNERLRYAKVCFKMSIVART